MSVFFMCLLNFFLKKINFYCFYSPENFLYKTILNRALVNMFVYFISLLIYDFKEENINRRLRPLPVTLFKKDNSICLFKYFHILKRIGLIFIYFCHRAMHNEIGHQYPRDINANTHTCAGAHTYTQKTLSNKEK